MPSMKRPVSRWFLAISSRASSHLPVVSGEAISWGAMAMRHTPFSVALMARPRRAA